jgi:murein hydrolase activator
MNGIHTIRHIIKKLQPTITLPLTLVLALGLFIGMGFEAMAQDKNSKSYLQRERNTILSRINKTNRILTRTRKDRTSALSQYYAISGQIKQREQLLEIIEKEIDLLNEHIKESKQS